jgi:hypothetical protein
MVCHIPLKIFQQGLQLFFKPHINRRFAHKIMDLQSCESPNLGNFETLTWDSWDKMTFECCPHGQAQIILYGEASGFPPKSRLWWVLWIHVCLWFVNAPKCSNYALTNLLFGLCRSMWIIDSLVTHLSPHPLVPTCPSTPEMLRAKERAPILSPSIVFTFGLVVESIQEFQGASTIFSK